MAWAFDDGPIKLWAADEVLPDEELCDYISSGGIVCCHNANFEKVLINEVGVKKYGMPPLKEAQLRCTMARAFAMALPGALENTAPALGLTLQKDTVGNRVMKQLSVPRKIEDDGTLVWWEKRDVPEKFKQLYAYNIQDVEVERALDKRLMQLSASEQELWNLDALINSRGVLIDLPAVHAAIQIVEAEKKRFNEEMREVTRNAVATATATGQLTDWLRVNGIQCEGVAKADIKDLLEKKDLTPQIRRALEIRQQASLSSTAKLKKMVSGACEDGRARGLYQYCGAGATRRFAGRRLQLQNFPRNKIPQQDIEGVFSLLAEVE